MIWAADDGGQFELLNLRLVQVEADATFRAATRDFAGVPRSTSSVVFGHMIQHSS
jgi:hypothetical protein